MKTKVFIITGFLGSGKTTLVKRILSTSPNLSGTVVLVNEFGKIGVDGELIKQTAAADVVELTSGCICCTLKTDMIQTLRMLRHDYSPEQIIIEATGVADPLSIIEVLKEDLLSPQFSLEKTVTVLDSDFWEAREGFGTFFTSQIKQADILLLNKVDTVDSSRLPDILREIRKESPRARIIPTLHCNIDPDLFWADLEPKALSQPLSSPFQIYDPKKDVYSSLDTAGPATAESSGFITFSFKTGDFMDENAFEKFLASQPLELFRIKGPVRFSDQTKVLNFVGGKTQWQPWPETISTRLAFIGWNVVENRVLEEVRACLAQ